MQANLQNTSVFARKTTAGTGFFLPFPCSDCFCNFIRYYSILFHHTMNTNQQSIFLRLFFLTVINAAAPPITATSAAA